MVVGCDGPSVPALTSSTKPSALTREDELAKATEAERVADLADCTVNSASKVNEYRALMAKHEYWSATLAIRKCSEILNDKQLKTLVADGEIKSHVQDIESPKTKLNDRLRAIESFQRDYPERGSKYNALLKKLNANFEQRKAENEMANRFTKKLLIGSTQHDIVKNGWGYPSGINKTTTANGVREQWVYGERRYLYFENGVLTAIQE